MEPGQSFDRYVLFADLKPRSGPAPTRARSFLALDRESGEVVVLQASAQEGEDAEVFLESCQRTRSAELPNSPALLAAGYHAGQAFVTHRWIAGVSFREVLQVVAPGEELARVLALEAARCLAQLHGQELVHGDVHPDNLLLRSDGKLYLVGHMPRPLGAPSTTLGPEQEAARYAAPEVLDGEPPGPASDVFAAGLVTFELFAGQRLLRSAPATEVRMDLEILDPSLETLLERNSSLRPPTRAVLARCLRFSRENRFRSGTELLDELLGQAPVAQAKPRESLLRGLLSQVPPQVTRQIYLRIREAIEEQDLPRAVSELWRYASLVPRGDRTRARSGYLATMEALWLCLLTGARGGEGRAAASAAAFLLHRLARTWGSRSLRLLATELCYRFGEEDSRFPELLGDPPIAADRAAKLGTRFREDLEAQPRSEKALLGLTVFTPDFEARPGESLGALKARVLDQHGLFRPALFYRCRDILDLTDASPVLQDAGVLLGKVREADGAHRTDSMDPDASDSSASIAIGASGPLPEHGALAHAGGDDPDSSSSEHPVAMVAGAVDVPLSSPMNDAKELFEEGQARAREGDVTASAAAFHELLGSGVLQREFYYSGVCSELRGLLWLLLRSPHRPTQNATRALWELAVEARLDTLLPLCEHLLTRAYANVGSDDEALAEVERMIAMRPGSFPLRQIAAEQALARQENFRWAEHLVAAARDRLENRDLVNGAKLLMAARRAAVTPALDEVHGQMIQLAEQIAEAGGALAEVMSTLSEGTDPTQAYAALASLAARYPGHEPTLEELARRARAAGYGPRASDVLMDLGRARMLREDVAGARRCFRMVLESEFENDEALLYLASLRELEGELPRDLALVRPTILAREGLYEAGIHRALQALDGSERDAALRELLIEMSQASGRDPSRHRVGLAILALGGGEVDRCRTLCDQAFAEAEHPDQLVEILMRVPQIELVYSRVELAQRRG